MSPITISGFFQWLAGIPPLAQIPLILLAFAAVVALIMRGGQVLDRRELFWEGLVGISAEMLLSEVLPQIYDRTTFIP